MWYWVANFPAVTTLAGRGVQAEWERDELIGAWTLVKGDSDLIANKAGVTCRLDLTAA